MGFKNKIKTKMEENKIISTTLRSLYIGKLDINGNVIPNTGAFDTIGKLRVNTNGYPFVTLIKGKKALNLYFGQKTAKVILATFNVGDIITPALANAEVVFAENEQGENRYKISLSGASNYTTKAEMEDVFGNRADTTEFDVKAFTEQFSTANATSVEA